MIKLYSSDFIDRRYWQSGYEHTVYLPTAAAVAALVLDCSPDVRESLRRELNSMVASLGVLGIQGLLPSDVIKGGANLLDKLCEESENSEIVPRLQRLKTLTKIGIVTILHL